MPVGRGFMIVDRTQVPGLVVTNTANSVFCSHNTFQLSAQITAPGGAIPPGSITFVTWNSGIATTQGTGAINPGTGVATYTLPANTLTPGQTYYIQATYPGSGSYAPQSTPANTSGVPLRPSTSLVTASVLTPISPFCVYSNENFNVTVTATGIGASNPISGSITIYGIGDSGPYSLGTGALSGSNVASIPCNDGGLGWNWPQIGTWSMYAVYAGDGSCYAGDTSPTVNQTTFINTLTLSAPHMNGGSPSNFCRNSGGPDSWTTVVTSSNGPATGTFSLFTTNNEITPIASVTTTVSNGGTVTISGVSRSLFTDGVQNAYIHFSPTSTTNCYNGANSPQTGSFTVVDSGTQQVTISIGVSSSPSGPFNSSIGPLDNTTTFYIQAVVNNTGTVGDDSGAVSIYVGTINGGPYPSIVTPPGSPTFTGGSNTFVTVGPNSNVSSQLSIAPPYFPNVIQDFYVVVVYHGNGCFQAGHIPPNAANSTSTSNQVVIHLTQQVH